MIVYYGRIGSYRGVVTKCMLLCYMVRPSVNTVLLCGRNFQSRDSIQPFTLAIFTIMAPFIFNQSEYFVRWRTHGALRSIGFKSVLL